MRRHQVETAVEQLRGQVLQEYCARKGIPRLDEIVGRAADAALGYGALAPVKRTSYPWDRFIRDA
jgi:hypothetical protein